MKTPLQTIAFDQSIVYTLHHLGEACLVCLHGYVIFWLLMPMQSLRLRLELNPTRHRSMVFRMEPGWMGPCHEW